MTVTTARTARRVATLTAIAAASLLAAGCAGDAPAIAGAQAGSSAASAPAAPPQPEEYGTVPAPGPPLGDTSALEGRTVYWIPITSVAPVFTVEGNAAAEAFASVGINMQVCDGQATPDAVGRCVSQAIAADAAGIIATSIPPEFSRQAFGNAIQAGIPMLFVNTLDASTPPEWAELAAALPNNWADQAKLNIDLIVEDSGGDANILVVGVTDSSTTVDFFENGMVGYLGEACPNCTVSTVPTGSTQISNLTSLVSSSLVKDPNIEYVLVQYDSFAAPVIQAIRQQNRQDSIKLVTHLGQLDGLQRVADGDQWANTGYSLSVLGYNSADILLRMMLGQDPLVDAHRVPIKTITSANVGELDLTQQGWETGQWQTDEDFRAMYRELWGATS